MFYSNLVKKASEIAFDAHKGDVDKGGYPYFMHPAFLAFQMDDEICACVAFLHDVVEDHGNKYSFEVLKGFGFYDEIIDALKLLTHESNVDYMEYVKKIKTNPYATKVKIADLKHNMDTRRTNGEQPPKFAIYNQALEYLQS